MLVIPEIDLSRGRCVRLTESGYEEEKVYFVEPDVTTRAMAVPGSRLAAVLVAPPPGEDGAVAAPDPPKKAKRRPPPTAGIQ